MSKLKTEDGLILIQALEGKSNKFNMWEKDFYESIRSLCEDCPGKWLTTKQSEKLEEMYRKFC